MRTFRDPAGVGSTVGAGKTCRRHHRRLRSGWVPHRNGTRVATTRRGPTMAPRETSGAGRERNGAAGEGVWAFLSYGHRVGVSCCQPSAPAGRDRSRSKEIERRPSVACIYKSGSRESYDALSIRPGCFTSRMFAVIDKGIIDGWSTRGLFIAQDRLDRLAHANRQATLERRGRPGRIARHRLRVCSDVKRERR